MIQWLSDLGLNVSGDNGYMVMACACAIAVVMVSTIVSALWSLVVGIFSNH